MPAQRRKRYDPDAYMYAGLEDPSAHSDDVAAILRDHWPTTLLVTAAFALLVIAAAACGPYAFAMTLWVFLLP